jgi:hypothetical protein
MKVPEYIARLVRKVVSVSVETVRLVAVLPPVVNEEEMRGPVEGKGVSEC